MMFAPPFAPALFWSSIRFDRSEIARSRSEVVGAFDCWSLRDLISWRISSSCFRMSSIVFCASSLGAGSGSPVRRGPVRGHLSQARPSSSMSLCEPSWCGLVRILVWERPSPFPRSRGRSLSARARSESNANYAEHGWRQGVAVGDPIRRNVGIHRLGMRESVDRRNPLQEQISTACANALNRMACGIARVARANPGIRGDFAPRDANYEIDVMGSSRAASARRDPADRAGSFTALAIDPSSLSWRMLSQISPL